MQASEAKTDKRLVCELFLLSLISIYFELLVIRWLSADFRAFTIFKTFPLVTCFVGLGVGYAVSSDKLFRMTPWALLKFIVIVQILEFIGFALWMFPSQSIWAWVWNDVTSTPLYLVTFISCLTLLLLGPFSVMACLGARLGQLFNRFKPLNAYCINIVGSMAGGIIYALSAFLGAPPWLALVPVAFLLWFYTRAAAGKPLVTAAALCAAVGLSVWDPSIGPDIRTYWSPYQRLEVRQVSVKQVSGQPELDPGLEISTNRHYYQYAVDLSDKYLSRPDLPDLRFRSQQAAYYNLPHKLKNAADVLVLGAGSGNDVAAALRNGARHVDAVDIDPVILRLGRESHPERPYSDSRVQIHCTDARHYMNHCTGKYDLIVFAGLDSHTISGQSSSVRLDNYVYTRESLAKAYSLLKPNGLIFLSFCQCKPWLTQRLHDTLAAATGQKPLLLVDTSGPLMKGEDFKPWEVYLAGPEIKDGTFKLAENLGPWIQTNAPGVKDIRILTDDWPFVYVTPVIIDGPYLLVLATVLGFSIFASRRFLFGKSQPVEWQLFFLGAGFLLLELQSIGRLSLIYGSTWFTSSVVINGVLLMILGANWFVIKNGDRLNDKQPLLYGLLFVALAISIFLPVDRLMAMPAPLVGQILVTVLTLLPMLCAGLVFAVVFRGVAVPSRAVAFNLLGSVIGALLEYLSNYVGVSGLVVVAAVLYAGSLICSLYSGKVENSHAVVEVSAGQ